MGRPNHFGAGLLARLMRDLMLSFFAIRRWLLKKSGRCYTRLRKKQTNQSKVQIGGKRRTAQQKLATRAGETEDTQLTPLIEPHKLDFDICCPISSAMSNGNGLNKNFSLELPYAGVGLGAVHKGRVDRCKRTPVVTG